MCAALLPLASCGLLDDGKDNTPSEGDNFVTVSVSDVRDGYFKLNFECGEGTQTIEYAVCRAVNMKTDSMAFKAGELDGVQRIELLDSATAATVEYDCSEPLDFGPYTVYARAVSSSGEVSAPVKAQVCALTTGVTVEYLSRAKIVTKTSHHGDDYICSRGLVYEKDINDYYGSFDAFLEEVRQSALESIQGGGSEKGPDGYEMWDAIRLEEQVDGSFAYGDAYMYFLSTDGTDVTGTHIFEVPRPAKDTSMPLPGDLIVSEFEPVSEIWPDGQITYSMKAEYTVGAGTELYAQVYTSEWIVEDLPAQDREDYPEYYGGMSDDEILKTYVLLTGRSFVGGIWNYVLPEQTETGVLVSSGEESSEFDAFGEIMYLIACPVNFNNESGNLLKVKIPVPSKEEFPDPVPGESSAPGLMTRSGLAGQSGAAQHMEHSGPFVEFI